MWGRGKFPIFSQLNILTTRHHIEDAYDFFTATYGSDGARYRLGDLCKDWRSGSATGPYPPWQDDEDNPWDSGDAAGWQQHCQTDLTALNAGLDQGVQSGRSVYADLTEWIKEAILAREQIVYKYRRDDTLKPPWKADRERRGNKWHITVRGPGF